MGVKRLLGELDWVVYLGLNTFTNQKAFFSLANHIYTSLLYLFVLFSCLSVVLLQYSSELFPYIFQVILFSLFFNMSRVVDTTFIPFAIFVIVIILLNSFPSIIRSEQYYQQTKICRRFTRKLMIRDFRKPGSIENIYSYDCKLTANP